MSVPPPPLASRDPLALDDTIVALATAPGRSAVALLRVSGASAFAIAARCVTPWPLAPRVATLARLRDPRTGEVLDRALVTVFPAPRSYTGEDVVEIATHGGTAVPAAVLAALVAAGARPAEPGEFTRRAVLRGRLDLAQAEAVGDLIDARTQAMRRAALTQLDGGLSRRVAALREALLHVEALLAYDIDFPEEDDGPVPRTRITAAADRVRADVDALLATTTAGAIARDGAIVVVVGPPNAGKSSLFNALAGEARALVTEVPGTTRDALEAIVEPAPRDGTRAPWPLRLIDTAGLRETADQVERLGIELSERWVRRAHLVLACGESLDDVARTAAHVATLTDAPVVEVWTKQDRSGDRGAASGERAGSTLDRSPLAAPLDQRGERRGPRCAGRRGRGGRDRALGRAGSRAAARHAGAPPAGARDRARRARGVPSGVGRRRAAGARRGGAPARRRRRAR